MAAKLSDYKALTFDCYGTLIDWESGIWDATQPLLMANNCDDVTRELLLKTFAEVESKQQAETPGMLYPELLRLVHGEIARRFALESNAELDEAFGASLAHWPAFPDSADALRRLKKNFKLVILSNVNRDGFAQSNRKLGVTFDAIYTAEDVGSYKPSPANFDHLINGLKEDLGLEAGEVLHTAQSLFHDHAPARQFGLANAWIDRQRLSEGGSWGATKETGAIPKTDYIFFTMAEMADALEEELK